MGMRGNLIADLQREKAYYRAPESLLTQKLINAAQAQNMRGAVFLSIQKTYPAFPLLFFFSKS